MSTLSSKQNPPNIHTQCILLNHLKIYCPKIKKKSKLRLNPVNIKPRSSLQIKIGVKTKPIK